MRALPAKVLREIRDYLDSHGGSEVMHMVAKIDTILSKERKRAKTYKARTAPKKKLRREKTSAIRAACMKRADERCENCGAWFLDWAPELDHFYGGSKKHSHESVDNCWALCGGPMGCHRHKTDNDPSRQYWVEAFLRHRRRHGLRAVGL